MEHPWLRNLRKAGLQGSTPRAVLAEALQVKSGAACEAALIATLNATRAYMVTQSASDEDKKAAVKAIQSTPEFKAVSQLYRCIMREAV